MERYSVLMSVYCNEKAVYLEKAVLSMLNQTVRPSDFVLVCDGPLTKELDEVIHKLEEQFGTILQIMRLPENKGLGIALQEGLKKCKYELVARMDSDDIAEKDRMETQLKVFELNPDVSVVGGQILEFNGDEKHITGCRYVPLNSDEIKKRAIKRNPMNHMTVTFKKSHVQNVGSYIDFDKFEDYYLWVRMLSKGYKFMNVDTVCVRARIDENMYKRRAGIMYFKQTVKLQKELLNRGFINKIYFLNNVIIRFVGTVILPNRARMFLYNFLLRKKTL